MRLRRIRHDLVDSTNERALQAIAAGDAAHGDVHLASGQTSGRGRRGRAWFSAEGQGLYASVVLLPPAVLSPAALTLAGGLTVLDAVRSLGLADARLAWPNDVVVRGAKLAGILAETRGLDARRPSYVLGIGLNVGQSRFPAELSRERAVTSLLQLGCRCSVQDAERALLAHLPQRLDLIEQDPDRLAHDFLAASGMAGTLVHLTEAGVERRGVLRALKLDRGLLLGEEEQERWVMLERIHSLQPALSGS